MKGTLCCVCGHLLDTHIDEGDGWRCHGLGPDSYQCECFLRTDRAGEEGVEYYNLERRVKMAVEELKKEMQR